MPRSRGPLFVVIGAAILMLGCTGYLAVLLESQAASPESATAFERFNQQAG